MHSDRVTPREAGAPFGDDARHASLEDLERGLKTLAPPRDVGEVALIVARGDAGRRESLLQADLRPQTGVPGDAWRRHSPDRMEVQISVMRVDVARLFANHQPLSLFGDNLLVDLDLSVQNLPAGSRLRAGEVLLEVTPEPHTGCLKFRQRFGAAALRLTADRRFQDLRLRGIYARVVGGGEISVGDSIEVVGRSGHPDRPARSPSR